MNRCTAIFALVMSLAFSAGVPRAQQTDRMPVVANLAGGTTPDDPIVEAFRQGLRELGYVEGRNIRIEFRTAQGHVERVQDLVQELLTLKPDVIVVTSTLGAQAIGRSTSTVPIVAAVFDPVASGLITNLARPGGNVTGLSSITTELSAKRLELLKETIPRLSRVAVLWNPDTLPPASQAKIVGDLNAAAPSLSIELLFVRARTLEELDSAFAAVTRARVQALYCWASWVGSPLSPRSWFSSRSMRSSLEPSRQCRLQGMRPRPSRS